MLEQKPTFEVTIATDDEKNLIYLQENSGPIQKCKMSDVPKPLLHMIFALEYASNIGDYCIKINIADIVEESGN